MKIRVLSLIFVLNIFSWLIFSAPKIILKLDDIYVRKGVILCASTLNFLTQNKIKAGLGTIAGRNDSTMFSTLKKYLTAENAKQEKLFEIWNHGYDHSKTEFKDSIYEFQKSHFEKANRIIQQLLGIQMHTFGTPFNASDSVTNRVIHENPDYKIFMYSSIKPKLSNEILYLDHRVNMENGTGKPEFDYFLTNYNKLKSKYSDYAILQGHPNQWNTEKLEQFRKIIDFLISEGCEFVTPYEYYLSKKSK
jgi:peptidoglycan/xylan/chitin deacetylase (PgdA/CDA1 family)